MPKCRASVYCAPKEPDVEYAETVDSLVVGPMIVLDCVDADVSVRAYENLGLTYVRSASQWAMYTSAAMPAPAPVVVSVDTGATPSRSFDVESPVTRDKLTSGRTATRSATCQIIPTEPG